MDEASGLIAELEQKLKELDHRVWVYRRDMISEFDRYVENLLEDVPEDISSTVTGAIAQSMMAYPSLDSSRHEADAQAQAQATVLPAEVEATSSTALSAEAASEPPRTLEETAAVSEAAFDLPRSPHARENEFAGVFTQSYLPLLDHKNRGTSARFETTTPSIAIHNMTPKAAEDGTVGSLSSSYSGPSSSLPRVAPPKRRNTADESLVSDKDAGPVRRSAMRRSSSSTKSQSPRHVRFEFAGEEFPTTSIPAPPVFSLSDTDAEPIGLGLVDSDEETGLLEVEDIAESPPTPKVSSSQALRALSRGPFEDDGTKWDEVVAPPDGSASISISEANFEESEEEEFLTMSKSTGHKSISNGVGSTAQKQGNSTAGHEEVEENSSEETSPTTSTESYQSPPIPTASSQSPLGKKEIAKSSVSQPPSKSSSKYVATTEPDAEDSDSDFFEFEPMSDSISNAPTSRSKSAPNPPSDSDSDYDSPPSPAQKPAPTSASLSNYSSSPARPIARLMHSPTGTTASQPISSSLRNSYHPFQTPVVNEAIHAKAAGMGVVNSFVGSVSGASGLDESDVRSFRGSFGGSSSSVGVGKGRGPGGARSLSERMLMEEPESEGDVGF